jgi:hypothetical protein
VSNAEAALALRVYVCTHPEYLWEISPDTICGPILTVAHLESKITLSFRCVFPSHELPSEIASRAKTYVDDAVELMARKVKEQHTPCGEVDYFINQFELQDSQLKQVTFVGDEDLYEAYALSSSTNTVESTLLGICPSLNARVKLPCACNLHTPLSTAIQHLNDNHRWARERIADWLDSLNLDLTLNNATSKGH